MIRFALLSLAAVLGLTAMQEPRIPDTPAPRSAPGNLDARLVELMRAGIQTTAPHARTRGDGDAAPFDGSWDWHSSVIAHWALLVHARCHDDSALRAWVLDRVTQDVVISECTRLRERDPRRSPVFPYDEGWLCLLLSELAAHRDESAATRALRVELEGRLLDRLESQPFPEDLGLSDERRAAGEKRYCGFYRSSLFLFLQLSWSGTVRDDAKARLDRWRRETLEPQRANIAAIEAGHGYDFLWVPALLALVDQLAGPAAGPAAVPAAGPDDGESPAYSPPPFEGWPESVTISKVHVLGMELCRVWPCASEAGAGGTTYRERVASLLEREDLWAENFMVCSHWLPQFLFIGEWLRDGRP